ncbi:sulfate ABC transporter substrate-binding protein [Leptospira jelokensis]|uniref:Sulfate ABC transporter substrate-binding protein n=1 Tax=Leptospira jelokensis TaxID=2484931 RepID=A0A4Z1A5K9_9LEPT|nr:sulfate ABC transporter substrate-binding protein [Leptospira jelokensis]TGL72209.1 sulfate ABC transporter substrate-binding protein [Leptospira jelokensis]
MKKFTKFIPFKPSFSAILFIFLGFGIMTSLLAESSFLHVSFDPTRELYEEINKSFLKSWKEKKGSEFTIQQSHGGSGKQARAVIDGLDADVVSLALSYDIDSIATKSKLIDVNWQTKLPNKSTPYYSTIIFLVRKSNPKKIKDWDDIVKPGVSVITPNPKTSGGARWNYLAAYGYAKRKFKSDEKATEFIKALYKNTSVLDTGARGSTTTFVNRKIGDVLITWENEAKLALDEEKRSGNNSLEVVYPSESIKAETPVAVVTKTATEKGNLEKANAYLEFLFTKEGQAIIAKHFFRPIDPATAKSSAKEFPKLTLFSLSDLGETWETAQKKHFADGGVFDAIYKTK